MKRIAVVEDNADNRMLVEALLCDTYIVSEYETGSDALDGITLTRPDLILLDISLPGMSGVEVLRTLRQRPELAGLPVIALTAHAMTGDREKYLSEGFDDYISKPIVDEEALLASIERLLQRPPSTRCRDQS